MRMEEVSSKILGYNNKTKHKSGVLLPVDQELRRYGSISCDYYWKVQDIHEHIKTYKYELLEEVQNGELIFLPFKAEWCFKAFDYIGCIDEDFTYEDGIVESTLFDVELCKELYGYVKECLTNPLAYGEGLDCYDYYEDEEEELENTLW